VKHCGYLSNFNYCRILKREKNHASSVTTDGSFTYQMPDWQIGDNVGAE
jgi:hypothetical protein